MTNSTISPLRQRMVDDMTIRGFVSKTQKGYTGAVRDFAAFLGRSPDQASAEDLRRYQLHMRSAGASATSMNTAVSGTAALGGHVARCEKCAHEHVAYNSCRNRHCPKCQGAAATDYLRPRFARARGTTITWFFLSSTGTTI